MKLRIGLLDGGGPIAEEESNEMDKTISIDFERVITENPKKKIHRGKRKNKDGITTKLQSKWNEGLEKWKTVLKNMKRIKDTKQTIQKKKEIKELNKKTGHDQWFGNKIKSRKAGQIALKKILFGCTLKI